jgi:uncharacterized protein (TIGR03437 family)
VKIVFSATGIGGSAIALDSVGNIYVAGTTTLLEYPTTPGVYQTVFPTFNYCPSAVCLQLFQGPNQYVTKIDPTGAKLIYSTALSGSGNTTNGGLAVDAAGDVYVTGFAGASYPFTVPPPVIPSFKPIGGTAGLPYLSKLDPTGHTLLLSVPTGGAGVQVNANGAVYVGGGVGSFLSNAYAVMAAIPALANIPKLCLPNNQTIINSAYVSQVDGDTGELLGTQFIGGSNLTITAVALSESNLWIAGATNLPDFPFTPNVLSPGNIGSNPLAGAFLGAVDFSQPSPPAGTPHIACVLDAGDLAPAGPAARYQILSIFGTELGPATGVNATGFSNTELAGVNVSFGSVFAPLLYVSSTQINFAVPLLPVDLLGGVMQLMVNRLSAPAIQLPLAAATPSLFINLLETFPKSGASPGFVALALNADGSVNSPSNPAHHGSVVSVFVNGLAPNPNITTAPIQLSTTDGWSVGSVVQINPFVLRVEVEVPSVLVDQGRLTLFYGLSDSGEPHSSNPGGQAFGGMVFIQ